MDGCFSGQQLLVGGVSHSIFSALTAARTRTRTLAVRACIYKRASLSQ
jgi:hypothetical protein